MRTAVFATVRNEADILPAFLRHILALFDYGILVDHRSIDGSAEMLRAACAGRPGWRCWRATYEGHHQQQAAAIGLNRLFQETDADIVCLLDADEFIDVADRTELERLFGRLGDPAQVGQLFWRNCIPANLGQDRFDIGDLIQVCPERSIYPKIVVPRALWHTRNGAARPTAGYHSIAWDQGAYLTYQPVGDLLHVPFRSRSQMERKLVLGRLADLARADRAENENVHWRDMLERVAAGAIDEPDLIGWITGYGEPGFAGRRVDRAGLTGLGFSLRPLNVAAVATLDLPSGRELDPLRAMAAVLCAWRLEDGGAGLCLDGDILHVRPPDTPPSDAPPSNPGAASASTTGEAGARQETANGPEAEIAALRHAIALAEQEATQARRQHIAAEMATHAALSAVQTMRASTSFRVTAPMRFAAASIRRMGRILPRRTRA